MRDLILQQLELRDEELFLETMQQSKELYSPWMYAPTTHDEFVDFYFCYNQPNQRCLLLLNKNGELIGIYSLSEITRGIFQNAYLGFCANVNFAGMGLMSAGLKLLFKEVFTNMDLHRLEANIQPENTASLNLVKSNCFTYEGLSRRYLNVNGEWRDFQRWAITIEDWQNNMSHLQPF